MPRSVQQSIPIDRIYADGVWQSENVFSLMWQISDINYAMQSDAAKQNILTQLGTVYAGIPADCWMQVCIVSQRMDEKAFARDVLYHRENDGFDALRAERNRQIKANARENGNVVQHKYIIVSTNKPGVKEARERFVQVQGHLLSAFSALECAVTPLDNRARLEVLHKFFRISEEGRFNFDFDNCAKLGQDFRDSIAPDCIRFCKKHIEIEDFYAKCMTISEYPQQLDDMANTCPQTKEQKMQRQKARSEIANAKPKGKRQVKASQGNTSYGKMVKQDKPFVKKQNTHTEQKPTAK